MFMGPVGDFSILDELILVAVSYWPITILVILMLICLVISGWWMLLEKSGDSGWKSLIPVYNFWTLMKVAGHDLLMRSVTMFLALYYVLPLSLSDTGVIYEQIGYQTFNWINLVLPLTFGLILLLIFYYTCYLMSRRFDKSGWYATGLFLLPFIFWPMLGFGDAQYKESTQSNINSKYE